MQHYKCLPVSPHVFPSIQQKKLENESNRHNLPPKTFKHQTLGCVKIKEKSFLAVQFRQIKRSLAEQFLQI